MHRPAGGETILPRVARSATHGRRPGATGAAPGNDTGFARARERRLGGGRCRSSRRLSKMRIVCGERVDSSDIDDSHRGSWTMRSAGRGRIRRSRPDGFVRRHGTNLGPGLRRRDGLPRRVNFAGGRDGNIVVPAKAGTQRRGVTQAACDDTGFPRARERRGESAGCRRRGTDEEESAGCRRRGNDEDESTGSRRRVSDGEGGCVPACAGTHEKRSAAGLFAVARRSPGPDWLVSAKRGPGPRLRRCDGCEERP